MSLFGSIFGDISDDPFMGGHMRQMSRMMNNMNSLLHPFGNVMGPGMGPGIGPRMGSELMPFNNPSMGGGLMPFGFGNMNPMFPNLEQMTNNPGCMSYSSSTVMTMTNGPDGQPQVYQASSSVQRGPNGVKETKKAVSDSRTGVKKLAIGHHIGERAHIVEREQNVLTGDQEERQDYINLEEEEAQEFDREWNVKTRPMSSQRAISHPSAERHSMMNRTRQLPALLPASSSTEVSGQSKSRKRNYNSDTDKPTDLTHQRKSSKISD